MASSTISKPNCISRISRPVITPAAASTSWSVATTIAAVAFCSTDPVSRVLMCPVTMLTVISVNVPSDITLFILATAPGAPVAISYAVAAMHQPSRVFQPMRSFRRTRGP